MHLKHPLSASLRRAPAHMRQRACVKVRNGVLKVLHGGKNRTNALLKQAFLNDTNVLFFFFFFLEQNAGWVVGYRRMN